MLSVSNPNKSLPEKIAADHLTLKPSLPLNEQMEKAFKHTSENNIHTYLITLLRYSMTINMQTCYTLFHLNMWNLIKIKISDG